ncbi:hypothetical protein GCM10023205_01510 [Yinghuangia aomiensis]|uniref:Metallo-beta-lactamase domain-containing protein n=1 Tax=Yinghuangia aomiensis TaxID=676205 RepID=A0ABP9GST8_9ACTN
MTTSPSGARVPLDGLGVRLLDVGHGNSAVVWDGTVCSVVDVAPGDLVNEELRRLGCTRIEHLVISHSDKDHAGGAARLLLDDARTIGTIWYTADGHKRSETWQRMLRAVEFRLRTGGLDDQQNIHSGMKRRLHNGRAWLECVHPDVVMAGTGPTGRHPTAGTLTANTVSVVVKVHLDDVPAALLTADIDAIALAELERRDADLTAPVLVFPHHGGRPGRANPGEFAYRMTQLVAPKLIVFSIQGGGRASNPHPDVVAAVRRAAPDAHIACTQVSRHCHTRLEPLPAGHLSIGPAAGRERGRCCAGSLAITSGADGLVIDPPLPAHASFVDQHVAAPLCRPAIVTAVPAARDGEALGG